MNANAAEYEHILTKNGYRNQGLISNMRLREQQQAVASSYVQPRMAKTVIVALARKCTKIHERLMKAKSQEERQAKNEAKLAQEEEHRRQKEKEKEERAKQKALELEAKEERKRIRAEKAKQKAKDKEERKRAREEKRRAEQETEDTKKTDKSAEVVPEEEGERKEELEVKQEEHKFIDAKSRKRARKESRKAYRKQLEASGLSKEEIHAQTRRLREQQRAARKKQRQAKEDSSSDTSKTELTSSLSSVLSSNEHSVEDGVSHVGEDSTESKRTSIQPTRHRECTDHRIGADDKQEKKADEEDTRCMAVVLTTTQETELWMLSLL